MNQEAGRRLRTCNPIEDDIRLPKNLKLPSPDRRLPAMESKPTEIQKATFQALRKEYQTHGIDDASLHADPIEQFRAWFDAAAKASPGDWFEANAMTIATSDGHGHVTARIVLMKGIEDGGIRFYTNYDSTKGQQLANNPRASVVFNWPHQGRQVRVEGTVEKTSREVSEAYFHSRPRGAQLGAVVSKQSSVVESRGQLDAARTRLDEELAGQAVPLPDNWGGYLVTPTRVEFWQGRLDRLHDRLVYESAGDRWNRFRISP